MVEVPLTEAQFAAAANRLRDYGVDLTNRSGTLSRDGITARYNYVNEMLTIEILDKPFFLPLSVIDRAKTILGKLESDDTTVSLPAPDAKPKKKITVAPSDSSQLNLL